MKNLQLTIILLLVILTCRGDDFGKYSNSMAKTTYKISYNEWPANHVWDACREDGKD